MFVYILLANKLETATHFILDLHSCILVFTVEILTQTMRGMYFVQRTVDCPASLYCAVCNGNGTFIMEDQSFEES